jgi:putative ABC transport system permease protein
MDKYLSNLQIASEAILANKLRAMLTALGIIFGVASVIAMLAIGNGAQQEIQEQIKLVGVNNIVINPIIEQVEEDVAETEFGGGDKNKFSPGLTMLDVENIQYTLPNLKLVSPEIELDTYIISKGIRRSAKLIGVNNSYFDIFNLKLERGGFFEEKHRVFGEQVCVVGRDIQTKFFSGKSPIGKKIKCGPHWLTIIGVLERRNVSDRSIEKLGIRNFNMDVYTPLQTVLVRYKNRSLVTKLMLQQASRDNNNNNNQVEVEKKTVNYHQLDKIVVQMEETQDLVPTTEIISRMLERRHYSVVDYEIEVPILLLEQQQRTNDIFNYVLFAIAFISLLVGGIGIMNIMLASVLERIKEIGLRLSLGAQKADIVLQFLFESMLISLSGGLIGVMLGIGLAFVIASIADIPTVISFASVAVSFVVAAGVGLIFGIAPAKKAADQDPIECLRYG